MRLHVGGHILKNETLQASTVCGFCGGSGCRTIINYPPGKAAPLMHSTCPYAPRRDARHEAVTLTLKSARVGSDTSPCTNVVVKRIFCAQDTHIRKYGMADHVARCHNGDTLVEDGTRTAQTFKEVPPVSESENARVLNKFKGGKLRVRENDDALPPGARRGVPGNGAPGRSVPGSWPPEDEEVDEDDDEDEDEDGEEDEGRG